MLIDDLQEKAHHIDTRSSQSRINYHTLSRLGLGDERANVTLLFSDKWGETRFETPCAKTHDDDGKAKRSKRPIRVHNDWWNGRDNKNDVPNESNKHRGRDSSVSSPLLVCNVGAEQWSDVTPILVFSVHFER